MKLRLGRIASRLVPVAAALTVAGPASAQIWIGQVVGNMAAQQARAQCMSGQPLPPDEIAEALDPARLVMSHYWDRASAADAADVTGAFHERGRADWVSGETTRRRTQLRAVSDPFARQAGAVFEAEPRVFVRAADGGSARGLWRVDPAQAGGQPLGYYLADFRRSGGDWKLRRVELLPGAATPPEVTQYCNAPGDIDRARAEAEAREARRAARRAQRETARAAQR